jgi:hypothetical protein
MKINIYFYTDWIEILKVWFSYMGYSLPDNIDPKEIPIIYANALRRKIAQAPRRIIKSREFTCLSGLEAGLRGLEAKVMAGVDINPHLSRSLAKPTYNDALLNDWGIFHFHLGEVVESNGFVERTGPLLFAQVTDNSFYEIGVYTHGNWTNLDIAEIIHSNWPETIERFKLKGILALSHAPSSADIKTLRNADINSFIQTSDGTIYAPIGGGYMTNGRSMEAVLDANRNIEFVKHLEKWVKDNVAILVEELKKSGYSEDKPLTIKFEVDEAGMYASCPEYGIRYILNKPRAA